MARKLKVYRTPIGFHDAYVAAPSQKAALEAWGSDVGLFGRGVADIVIDEDLIKEPLASPGKVIRRLRGSDEDHFEALKKAQPRKPRRAVSEKTDKPRAIVEKPKARPKPKPKPSRAPLEKAELELEQAKADQEQALEEIRQADLALVEKRRKLEEQHERVITRLEEKVSRARDAYEAAIERWVG